MGVSGGADSVALLVGLTELARAHQVPLTVAHAHHGLRGAEADADAALVQELATRLGWACVVARVNVRGEMNRTAGSLEMTARRLRHAFLARTAREVGARSIALAHHGDDQTELFLLRLFRGSGGDGLGGMAEISPSPSDSSITLLRPLLSLRKVELRDFVAQGGWPFREDGSNQDLSIPRNHIRQTVLPWLREQVGAHLDQVIRRSAELVGADAECVESLAEKWTTMRRPRAFDRLPVAVQRAVIRRQLWDLGCPVDFDLVERLRRTQSRQSAAAGRVLRRQPEGGLESVPPTPGFTTTSAALELGSRGSRSFDDVELRWRRSTAKPATGRPPKSPPGTEQFDAAAVGPQIHLRHWLPGDRFQPLGMAKPTKLQDVFTNRKVPGPERRQRVVATTAAGEIFWVEGLPPGDPFKVQPHTAARLVWTWQRTTAPAATRSKLPAASRKIRRQVKSPTQ